MVNLEGLKNNFNTYYTEQKEEINKISTYDVLTKYAEGIKSLESCKRKLDRAVEKLDVEITEWKKGKTSSGKPVKWIEGKEREKITKRAKIVNTAGTVCLIAAAVLGFIAGGIALGPVFVFTLAEIFRTASLVLAGISLGSGALSCSLFVATGILQCLEVHRKARVANSKNFREFVETHVISKDGGKGFTPDRKALFDKKLHEIYLDYKKTIKSLPQRKQDIIN